MSVSVPLLTPSLLVGAWQTLPVHTLLVQSRGPAAHALPTAHAGAPFPPPQSRSVSVPFFTPSVGEGT
jgi:hypothetical protein